MKIALDILGIVGGVASVLGAWWAWQQRLGAAQERAAAGRERQAAQDAARQARKLVELQQVQRLFAECIFSCRRLQTSMGNDVAMAIEQLSEAIALLGRLSGEALSKGRQTPSAWLRMREDLVDLAAVMKSLGNRQMPFNAQAPAMATVLRIMGELERLAADIPRETE